MRPKKNLVVVGSGPAGARVVEEVLHRAPDRFTVTLFGDEPHLAYNRVQLSAVLGGLAAPQSLFFQQPDWYDRHHVRLHTGVRVQEIDSTQRLVRGTPARREGINGHRSLTLDVPYDSLVLATGSRPFVPPIQGRDLSGVFVFRTLDDCAAISRAAEDARRAVVIGGGLLGLEAARGLLEFDLEVTVVELAPHLMAQQLDGGAGEILQRALEKMGVRVLTGVQSQRFTGQRRVESVELTDGRQLDTDLVVISCGIRPSIDLGKSANLEIHRGILVDDQLRTSNPHIFALGECSEHRGQVYGLVEPIWEQADVLADVLTGINPKRRYEGSQLATTLKVMGVDLTVLGDVHTTAGAAEVLVHSEPERGVYRKLVCRAGKLAGAILLGDAAGATTLLQMFREGTALPEPALDLLRPAPESNGHLAGGSLTLADDVQICNCHRVKKSTILAAINHGCDSVGKIGLACKAGTGCGSCQGMLGELLAHHGGGSIPRPSGKLNRVEEMKQQQDGIEALPMILSHAQRGSWEVMTEDDKQRSKWYGLFFRKQTPGNFMLRVRSTCGFTTAAQFRVLADLSDEFGKGFCDLTTRQQLQLRWFTIRAVPEIWRRLEAVGLTSKQTGMDNIRGVCGCPLSGVTQHEWFDAAPVAREFTDLILDNREFTNLPRKFNVTITGCLENCCHTETQDLALVPSYRELEGERALGFNVLVGGKQGSGGYTPAQALDVFIRREEAAALCGDIVRIFRDHGPREQRNRARLAFLLQDRGLGWFRQELQQRWRKPLLKAGPELRKPHHTDHLGIVEQPSRTSKSHKTDSHAVDASSTLHSVGILVPVGRITTKQMREVADLADRYGTGEIRLTVQQNLVIPNVPLSKLGALTDEPVLKELPFDPSPVMRGLVSCVGSDYCHFALIETKGWALQVAQELERRTAGHKLRPLTIHWSGCPAGCGLHQVSTIGLQGCRSRVNGQVVDAAHVYINGESGPHAQTATDLMYDVPCEQLADSLEAIVKYLPRKG